MPIPAGRKLCRAIERHPCQPCAEPRHRRPERRPFREQPGFPDCHNARRQRAFAEGERQSHHHRNERQRAWPIARELQYFPSSYSYTATQDPDKDGLNNFLELAFNLDPTRSSVGALVPDTGTAGLPVAYLTQIGADVHLTLEFVRRKNAGMTYTVQFANAPGAANWQAAVNAPIVTPINANWERVVVDDPATVGANTTRFGRVVVSKP